MPGIIKTGTSSTAPNRVAAVAFNYDDVTSKASAYLEEVKAEAASILEKAREEANRIRQSAQAQGELNARQLAERNVQAHIESQIKQQMQTVLPALEQLTTELAQMRFEWLAAWEKHAIELAVAISEKILRRELAQDPKFPATLVKEAVELATGSQNIKIHLNPQDHATLGPQIQMLVNQLARFTPVEILPNEAVSPGECLAKTEYGEIDLRIQTQLERIQEELL